MLQASLEIPFLDGPTLALSIDVERTRKLAILLIHIAIKQVISATGNIFNPVNNSPDSEHSYARLTKLYEYIDLYVSVVAYNYTSTIVGN